MDLRLWGLHGDTRQRMRRHGSQVMQRGSAKATEESRGGRSLILGSPRNNCCVTRLPASPTGSADDTACYKSRVTYLMTVTAAQVPRGSSGICCYRSEPSSAGAVPLLCPTIMPPCPGVLDDIILHQGRLLCSNSPGPHGCFLWLVTLPLGYMSSSIAM